MQDKIMGMDDKIETNKDFWILSIGALAVLVFLGALLCREGVGICEVIIMDGSIYMFLLYTLINCSIQYFADSTGITITFYNFKVWTAHFNWDEYYEIEFETPRRNDAGIEFVMTCKKRKKHFKEFIFSGTVRFECTEENYALIKSWIPDSVRIPKVKF